MNVSVALPPTNACAALPVVAVLPVVLEAVVPVDWLLLFEPVEVPVEPVVKPDVEVVKPCSPEPLEPVPDEVDPVPENPVPEDPVPED